MRFFIFPLLLFLFSSLSVLCQTDLIRIPMSKMQYLQDKKQWVDSVFNHLSEEEKIAQLFMIAAYSNRDEQHKNEVAALIKDYNIGGLIFFQGAPVEQAKLTNEYQALSKVPLLIAMDAEWGLGMRLDSTISFPRQLTLGAINDNKLIYEMGEEVARQCKRLGVHVNFAPVVDVNNNPNNPVINDRSFGEDKMNVAIKGLSYMEGMQDAGIIACAKHFPGHGDTDSDSHLTLPVINHPKSRLEELEFYPFKILINNGVKSIMAAHIHVPALDSTPQLATSLSKKVTTDLLKNELGFKGLVFSDALNMKGVSQFFKPGEVDLKAFEAGNDVLLFAEDVPRAIDLFKKALKRETISQDELNASVRKILETKYDVGLHDYAPVKLKNLTDDLNAPSAQLLSQRLYEAALTLVRNKDNLIPFQSLDTLTFASLSIGATEITPFQESLGNYELIDHYQVNKQANAATFAELLDKLTSYKVVIVGLHDLSKYASKGFGVTAQTVTFIKELSRTTKVVLTIFGSPYSLKYFSGFDYVLVAYEDKEFPQQMAAQALFGGVSVNGELPVTASEDYMANLGVSTPPPIRLKYTMPEEAYINSDYLKKIDTIAWGAIADKATPGCQILIAKDGKVILNKGYGYHSYKGNQKVVPTDIYDLASITKVAATTLSLMELYDERKFQLNRRLADYISGIKNIGMKNLIMKNILTHTSGLKSWIPFYLSTLADSMYGKVYSSKQTDVYNIQVAENLYISESFRDTIYNKILNSDLSTRPQYQYSDLGFYLYKVIVESLTEQPFDDYVNEHFYKPLGLATMTFNPLKKFPKDRLVPTEKDLLFRKQLLQGYVHDPGAAMLGGVSGHAGLFSNANDLAIIMQMLLNRGEYGGKRYINPTTVSLFTKKHSNLSRRGLGFDKPEQDIYKPQPTARDASPRTFGHSGFTGTCIWADPDNQLIYIFLSNRVHPSAENNKLIKNNVRTDIHQVIYDAIKKSYSDLEKGQAKKNN